MGETEVGNEYYHKPPVLLGYEVVHINVVECLHLRQDFRNLPEYRYSQYVLYYGVLAQTQIYQQHYKVENVASKLFLDILL